jgi:hypothetical protein
MEDQVRYSCLRVFSDELEKKDRDILDVLIPNSIELSQIKTNKK